MDPGRVVGHRRGSVSTALDEKNDRENSVSGAHPIEKEMTVVGPEIQVAEDRRVGAGTQFVKSREGVPDDLQRGTMSLNTFLYQTRVLGPPRH